MTRNAKFLILFGIIGGILIVYFYATAENEKDTLKLVHVLFRHGNKTPDQATLYRSDPYYNESYYKEGYGQLTNAGKNVAYKLGKELRQRYDKFLTDTWNYKYLSARTTNYPRTSMSLQVVLSALYPPCEKQMWLEDILWQPIPYEYLPILRDKELAALYACSTNWNKLYNDIMKLPEISNYLKKYDDMLAIIKANTNLSRPWEGYYLYHGLTEQLYVGYPSASWKLAIYPEPSQSAAIDVYNLNTYTTAMKRLQSGYLLKKILEDTAKKSNGTIVPIERKMFLYSAHDITVAGMLRSLQITHSNIVPPFGSYILFEVHEINGVYGIKLFYQFYEKKDPIPIKLSNCDYFCPYDKFYQLVEYILPESDDECYNS